MTLSPRLWSGLVLAASLVAGWLAPWGALSLQWVPDLPLLAVIAVATRLEREEAMLAAAATGLVADVFSAQVFGSRALVFVAVAWFSAALAGRVNPASVLARLLLAATGVLAADVAARVVAHLLDPGDTVSGSSGLGARVVATTVAALLLWRAPARPEPAGRLA